MQNRANYNYIAPFYDRLCQLVFGQSVKNAQIESLQSIHANSSILIVGGGTGWILEEIARIHPSGLSITYVDSASKMIQLSKKRNAHSNTVNFISGFIEDADLSSQQYDVVITPFLFSGFSQSTSGLVFQRLNDCLKVKGLWINIDFIISEQSRYKQKILLKLMFFSFRLVSKIEAKRLPTLDMFFSSYNMIKNKTSCRGFINMQVFQKGLTDAGLN
jgi:ubiquinone/menaquinone biosynthesis C-methylase UbiE